MRFLLTLSLLAALAAVAPAYSQTGKSDNNVQVITVTAKKYEYSPNPIHVKKGATVQLKITATDHTHGFKIDPYPDGADHNGTPGLTFVDNQLEYKLEEGQERVVEFTANQVGTYNFKCSVFCGFGHGHMKGQIVVDP